jgi:hypothetical protein
MWLHNALSKGNFGGMPAKRLHEIERGDDVFNRLLISFISLVSRMRLPDAARVAFYHKDFFATPMGAWTQAAMRGPSTWSIGDRLQAVLH